MIAMRNRPEKASVYDLLHQEASQINQKLEAKRAAKAAAQMEVGPGTVLCWLLLYLGEFDGERIMGGDFPGSEKCSQCCACVHGATPAWQD